VTTVRTTRPARIALRVCALPVLALVSACGGRADGDTDAPLHAAVICIAGTGELESACSAGERVVAFDAWVAEAIHHPGSTFTVWTVAGSRTSIRSHTVACVPSSWGGGVMRAKAAFIAAARQRAGGTLVSGDRASPPCAMSVSTAPGVHSVRMIGGGSGAPQWLADTMTGRGSSAPLHAAVLCDRSDSGRGATCTRTALVATYDAWVRDGGAAAEATFTVYLVGTSRDTARRMWAFTTPHSSPGERMAVLLGAGAELEGLLSLPAESNASAIAEALDVASSELADRPGRRQLIVLSDLRQFTRGVWNFERRIPSAADFIRWLDRSQLVADLHDTPVIVCGLHNERAPSSGPFDARLAAAVREIWEAAFRRMGVPTLELYARCDAPEWAPARRQMSREAAPIGSKDFTL
jgi:hypothetical protein